MKLRDLVANSLPRVRGRKKKAAVVPPVESVSKQEIVSAHSVVDKNGTKIPSFHSRTVSRDDCLELQGIAEASWRGNALYRGLEAARAAKYNSRMMSTSYTSAHGMVTSHSAEGFSSQLMMMSRSYDSRMSVPDCNESCPQMSSISEAHIEPYKQQYYHCHYHRHHHYHYHHLQSKPTIAVEQNQERPKFDSSEVTYVGSYTAQQEGKPELGFFRKSFASLGGIRNKSKKDSKQNEGDKIVCPVCPRPGTDKCLPEKQPNEKRPVKPKRKSLKGFGKLKDNHETVLPVGKCGQLSVSDNDLQHRVRSTTAGEGHTGTMLHARDSSNIRERSVESCSSRLYGSREGSCVRELDFTGFDSASLSGYESDLPRSKGHRSRSRIKTNPWLPSPQPPVSGGARGQHCDLHESREDVDVTEEAISRLSRSASFDHQRKEALSVKNPQQRYLDQNTSFNQRPRSLTPNEKKVLSSINPPAKPLLDGLTQNWWTVSKEPDNSPDPKGATGTKLNDLSNDVPRSRPTSTVSPNSEFVMLADNLEQLANNISFEYEEILDSTLESVSICQQDGEASIQELLTDEENVNIAKDVLKSDVDFNIAQSPDSGISGIGSTDGDDAVTLNSQTGQNGVCVERLPSSNPSGTSTVYETDTTLELSMSNNLLKPQKNKSKIESKCLPGNSSLHSRGSHMGDQTPPNSAQHKSLRDKRWDIENDSSATLSESDVDNTSYQDISNIPLPVDIGDAQFYDKTAHATKRNGSGSHYQKDCFRAPCGKMEAVKSRNNLMIDERLDVQFQPKHRQIHGSGILMGSMVTMHERSCLTSKQTSGKMCGSSAEMCNRNSRPSALRTCSRDQDMPAKMNDMEKGSDQLQHPNRLWSTEFDFPRNIPFTECVESPTENWRCDDQFSATCSQQIVPLSSTRPIGGRAGLDGIATYVGNEELIVKLDDTLPHNDCQRQSDLEDVNSCTEHDFDRLENEYEAANFQMNDACVQTDFDDDFSRWDESDTLESLEDKAIDPAECTRIWLLTGNMQGSADTGYSSQARDSLIITDEDSLLAAGELEERAAAERLSYGESSSHEISHKRAPSEYGCHKLYSFHLTDSSIQPDLLSQKEESRVIASSAHIDTSEHRTIGVTFSEKGSLSTDLHSKSFFQNNKMSNFTRPVLNYAVLPSSSNRHSYYNNYYKTVAERSSSDSSDQTLKSSDSDELEYGHLNKSAVSCAKNKDSETGETKVCVKQHSNKSVFTNNNYESGPVWSTLKTVGKGSHGHSQIVSPLNESTGFGNQCPLGSKTETPSAFNTYNCYPSTDLTNSRDISERLTPTTDRADYLEFLKDAPLDRSHLKRPLFLVPGLGPVDMSSCQQINIFSPDGEQSTKKSLPYSNVPCPSLTPSMSPYIPHCGKKLKYKKGNYTNLVTLPSAERHSPTNASSLSNNQTFSHGRLEERGSAKSSHDQSRRVSSNAPYSDTKKPAHLAETKDLQYATSTRHIHHPPSDPQQSTSETTPQHGAKRASNSQKQKDDATRSLRDRVMSLRREKDMVFQKIQEARQDERLRQEQRVQIQGNMHVQRKQVLLETLHELKNKLEEQSKLLKLSEESNTDT